MRRWKRWTAILSAMVLLLSGSDFSGFSTPSAADVADMASAADVERRAPHTVPAPYAELMALPEEERPPESVTAGSSDVLPPGAVAAGSSDILPPEAAAAGSSDVLPPESAAAGSSDMPEGEITEREEGADTAADNTQEASPPPFLEKSPLKELGDNPQKRLLLFGDENWDRYQVYPSEEEAALHMTVVQVPVWFLWGGEKSPGIMNLTVHQALAEDVAEIFTEIFNDPEQFPIESMGGFRYRTGTTGEHNNGTAIDLNADQNFQVRDGAALTGSCWEPGVNPYSIPADGSVVRVFAEHGWSWGGDAWAENADAATGYHDYMHFSYRGR